MKTRLLAIVGCIALAGLTLVVLDMPNVFAKCLGGDDDDNDCHGIPGMSPLKEQIELHALIYNIKCPNHEHVLVERPNGKLACVTNHTAHKTGWLVHHYSMPDSKGYRAVTDGGMVRLVHFEATGLILKGLSFERHSLIAEIEPTSEYGIISFPIQDVTLNLDAEQCHSINNHAPTSLSYVVAINEEKYNVRTSTNFWGETVLNIYTTENARIVEIVGICKN